MTLLALLVSNDDSAADVLGRILPASGIALERFSDLASAIHRLREQQFDVLIADFEYPAAAAELLDAARSLNAGKLPIKVALIGEPLKTRDVLNRGAHFILYKPLSDESAGTGLRAAVSLLHRERRRSHRVPVQAQVQLTLPDTRKVEGILLDLSETGMEVLTAQPQHLGTLTKFHFQLPGAGVDFEAYGQVAWANPNGETGIHFLDVEEGIRSELQAWLLAAAGMQGSGTDTMVPRCQLTDLSLGGCYVETDSPFPEQSLVELSFSAEEMAVQAEGMVRVIHPGQGMGVEFPSRTPVQRGQVGSLIEMLRSCTDSKVELRITPRALTADLIEFERIEEAVEPDAEPEDSLLELLRKGTKLQQDEFLLELRRQRSSESLAN